MEEISSSEAVGKLRRACDPGKTTRARARSRRMSYASQLRTMLEERVFGGEVTNTTTTTGSPQVSSAARTSLCFVALLLALSSRRARAEAV